MEDEVLLEAMKLDLPRKEIGKRYAEQLDRTPGAIRARLRKLAKRGRRKEAATPKSPPESRISLAKGDDSTVPLDRGQLASLLEASLILAEDPEHLPAIRVLLSQAIRLLRSKP